MTRRFLRSLRRLSPLRRKYRVYQDGTERKGSAWRKRVMAAALVVVAVAGVALPLVLNMQHAAAWWSPSWGYRRKITFDNSASATDLPNFPVRVSLTSSQISYANTQSLGQDIRFVDSDDTTPLNYEIDTWNASGTSEVWVQVPQIDAGSTTDFIWMYYGNPSASDGQNPTGVWDSYTALVEHLSETGACSVTFKDSTSPNNDGSCIGGGPAANSSGQIGATRTWDHINDGISVADDSVFDPGANGQTIEFWVNTASTTQYQALMAHYDNSGAFPGWGIYMNFATGTCAVGKICYWDGTNDRGVTSGLVANTWAHVVTVKSGTSWTVYVNGVNKGSQTVVSTLSASSAALEIGQEHAGEFYNGALDEVRYSTTARSADWVEADYLTQSNNMNTFGSEEQLPPDAPTLTAISTPASLTPTFQLRATDPMNANYLRYKIQVCSVSDCSSVVRTIDQTASQTGWSGQDAQTGTAYVASSTLGGSTLASHTYQGPGLSYNTQYWWRAYAIDPGGSNTFGPASAISTFTTNSSPAVPTLVSPASGETGVSLAGPLRLRSTDVDSDYLQYKIDICSTSNCSSIVRTIDQTASQTGWMAQGANSGTAYTGAPLINDSQVAVHVYQPTLLTPSTQYWWRAYAIDPGGTNAFSSASSISTFTTGTTQVNIQGGTKITGGTKIGQ